MESFGIDALALAVPRSFLEVTDLAAARGVAPSKFVEGLGMGRIAIASADEDPVTLAADAARRLLATPGVDKESIGLVIVGTETAVDHSKPIAAYLHGLLGLPSRCRVYETKHACFGGTAGLLTALDWLASGSGRGRAALVVCTDIARYTLGTPGEPTQGAGAVAMLVKASPRLLALEPGVSGSFARDVADFWRPLDRKDAIVDGALSVRCYLDALGGAYTTWVEETRKASGNPEDLARRCYHVPYGKMAKKAHQHLSELRGLDAAAVEETFQREVKPSLRFSAEVGNVYTGSLYFALASLLDAEAGELEGKRVGLFSYGSGSCAEFFAGTVEPGAGAFVRALDLGAPLRDRTRLTVEAYEAIRRADAQVDTRDAGAVGVTTGNRVAFLGIDGGRRVYQ